MKRHQKHHIICASGGGIGGIGIGVLITLNGLLSQAFEACTEMINNII